tara:strand:- start:26 stop:256 length:231 start_codon:yes stop_codon:yes gene_type:complete
MTTNKNHREKLIEILNQQQKELETVQDLHINVNKSGQSKEQVKRLEDSWDVRLWLIKEVIQPALEEALVEGKLKNF